MLFHTLEFSLFFTLVFLVYWVVLNKQYKIQNLFLLLASYFFYACWDWRFLLLIFASTFVDYFVGLNLEKASALSKRKWLLLSSLIFNLGMLAVFKYYDFFIDSFVEAFSFFNIKLEAHRLNLMLPIGISFYTFQTLSYTIDIYRNQIRPTSNFVDFALFVSFFPQLVAGPIERATHLLPQISRPRLFNSQLAADGLRQLLWGIFKKVVIADSCSVYVDYIYGHSDLLSGSTILFGACLFTIQVYCDFSGYSDMAIGLARVLGFDLRKNFAFPLFSKNIAEFWRRWHISLTSWFKDYVYFPLGGSREGLARTIRNIFIVFLISGFWHGANWTFIIWGLFNAFLFIPTLINKQKPAIHASVYKQSLWRWGTGCIQIAGTFFLFSVGMLFFRAENIQHLALMVQSIFSMSLFERPSVHQQLASIIPLAGLVLMMLLVEWLGKNDLHALEKFAMRRSRLLRYGFYYVLIYLIFKNAGQQQEFVYFQF